jgi:hypothetical protein
VKGRRLIVGIVCAAALAVITGSVLLLGYLIAGASLLLMASVLIRRVVRRGVSSPVRTSHTRWLDVSDREAA